MSLVCQATSRARRPGPRATIAVSRLGVGLRPQLRVSPRGPASAARAYSNMAFHIQFITGMYHQKTRTHNLFSHTRTHKSQARFQRAPEAGTGTPVNTTHVKPHPHRTQGLRHGLRSSLAGPVPPPRLTPRQQRQPSSREHTQDAAPQHEAPWWRRVCRAALTLRAAAWGRGRSWARRRRGAGR